MKPLSRWFRHEPAAPPSLQERVAALDTGSPDLIRDTALGSEEESLRVAAIQRLSDGADLRRLAALSDAPEGNSLTFPAALQRTAQQRMAELIDAGSIDFTVICQQAKRRPALFSVAALCKDTGHLAQALASIDDPEQVARLVMEGPTSRLRQSAAELVEDRAQLRQLLKHARDKDRSVYKILKQKHDALVAADREAARLESESQALCASLEQHAQRSHDPSYAPTFEHLHTRWRTLTPRPPAALEQRADHAAERCKEVIALAKQRAAQQAAAEAAAQAVSQLRECELLAAHAAAAAQAEVEAQLARKAAAERAAADQLVRQIRGFIGKAHGALRDGNTHRAAGLRRAIGEKLQASAAVSMPLTRQLQQLDEKLNELKQWKDYVVAPKRVELSEAMEALIGSPESPQDLAKRIKALQLEWQTISKGIAADAPTEWERFHQASRAAYQPCQEYFAAQAKLHQENLERREAVLARLTAFEAAHEGDNPDWRLLSQVLREAPQEWRRYFPVERDLGEPVQREFDASMGRLQAKLDAWHERNAEDKQTLIKRARHLLEQEESRDAVDTVKRLQSQWKETGPPSREQQQSLWNEFREVCDAVYQKRQQAFADYTAALEANKVKAVALCEQTEQAAALSGAALFETTGKIPQWQTAFAEIDEMPRTEARGLQERFERALDECQKQVSKQRRLDAEQSFTDLLEAGRRIRAFEWAVMDNAGVSEQEGLKAAAEAFIADVPRWPKGGLAALKEALAKAGAVTAKDSEAREKALRTLCIRCEIASEALTPPEDATLRREHQVQRLMQAMGQGNSDDEGDADAMIVEWIRISAITPHLHASLQERFARSRTNIARRQERSAARSGERSIERSAGRGRDQHH